MSLKKGYAEFTQVYKKKKKGPQKLNHIYNKGSPEIHTSRTPKLCSGDAWNSRRLYSMKCGFVKTTQLFREKHNY